MKSKCWLRYVSITVDSHVQFSYETVFGGMTYCLKFYMV
jgi:hypothetical protein